ncbi:pentatricopeptide repeat-containing protein At3g22150, chloroplastic [Ziziphus jujuba]|uniref:Pentatricopeptide repeat-containing protein At3g22150, chloroplastic n=1 Tax=Ziziphus jujuba TaxID=326968 RepID=A0ABM3I6U9_ZIZJJ|nr:pentatricopeptide repeat-containing protein At3g22150, chloroplastic [Ziziphus jujuba]XP_048321788.2 pentatricopeptide repeat-containing protein At3g22150, chloroplastic [Ziziphus jujuba]XP_048321789.2 pentatricopeptide repeat-containing protein At3g22150, chloroplastic [Ziziphus jujuba]XP_048321790.2 pentatricopeptide repeat-containing protein At3g22150, chloroplastic [Ziziphus jujuba]XP_048321791.2 pentatricopeptide repeat-containing protein At3g22150, chloroplastic [Ziziphus jujuba]
MASPALPLSLSPSSSPTPQSPNTSSTPAHQSPSISVPKPKKPTIRSRLSKLCQEGQPHLARQLFDTLPRPTTVLWNTIIIGFICNSFPDEALLLYAQMKKAYPRTKCDSYTYSSTLKACAETRNLRIGKAVHCHVLRCLSNPSMILYNSLLNMYSTCLHGCDYSRYDVVRKVFDTMHKRNVVAWNTLVSWYVKTERYEEAIEQFITMMRMRIKPSAVSFVNVFPALAGMKDYKNANVLYGLLIRMGSEYVNDLFVVSSGIFMFSELGCLDLARKIFDLCLERNTEVWNTMIGGYVQNNLPAEAIELFLQAIQSEQAVLDEVTLLSALTAVSQLQQLELAQQLHAFTIKKLQKMPTFITNALIVMYSRCDFIDMSFKIFHEMVERDVVSWNTMISSFVQNGLDDEAIMLVYEMQKQQFTIDSVTVTALLSAASNIRNPNIGKQTHAYLIRHGIEFEGMESYLIDMYAKSGLVRISQLLFEKNYIHQRDLATWNSMIAGYTQNGLTEEAFVVLRLMIEQNLVPNAVTLASVLPACHPLGNIDLGKQLHGFSVRHYLDQNVFVATALIDMYSKSGAITYAEKVFSETTEKNSVTYTTMILGYGQHGMGGRALSLFYSMQGCGIKPDAITFVAVLSACSYAGLVDEGLNIFQSMKKEYGIQPSTAHYCCVADMLGRVGRVVEAYEFVKGLGEEGNIPEIWGSLLGACRIHDQFELGKVVAEKLLGMEAGNGNTGYHVLLSNMYADEGKWENVDKVRKQMREKGLRKETGRSWIEISGLVNYFVSRDQEHPQCDEIYNMLRELAMAMKAVGYKPCLGSDLDGISESDE